jgi:ferredoxin
MSRPLWFVELIKKVYPGRDLLARSTRAPILKSLIDYMFFHGDALWYLPANKSIKVGEVIPGDSNMALPSGVVEHFIKNASIHWIMTTCICRDASGCQDYPVDLGCLFMGQAAANINPELGNQVSQEEALAHVEACREAGLVHLIGRNKLDTQWLGVGPGTRLLTVCNCCPCCCLWRMLPYLAPNISQRVQPMPGVKIEVTQACVGCGDCDEDICFVNAIEMDDGRAIVNGNCVGCGRCLDICPVGAIQLRIADMHFIQSTIESIIPLVQVE